MTTRRILLVGLCGLNLCSCANRPALQEAARDYEANTAEIKNSTALDPAL